MWVVKCMKVAVGDIVQVHQHSYIVNLQPVHLQAAQVVQRDAPLNESNSHRTNTMGC